MLPKHAAETRTDLLTAAAAEHPDEITTAVYVAAPHRAFPKPRGRALVYLDLRATLLTGDIQPSTPASIPRDVLMKATAHGTPSGRARLLIRIVHARPPKDTGRLPRFI